MIHYMQIRQKHQSSYNNISNDFDAIKTPRHQDATPSRRHPPFKHIGNKLH